MKIELIEGSETSAISIVTPGNYPKENILHIYDAFLSLITFARNLLPCSKNSKFEVEIEE